MNSFANNFSPRVFMNSLNQKLEEPVKNHLASVYGCMSLGLMTTAFGCYRHHLARAWLGSFLPPVLFLGFLMALMWTPPDGKNHSKRMTFYLTSCLFMGVGLGPLVEVATIIESTIVPQAFLFTCLIFSCFSLSTIFSDQRKWLYIGGTLSSALSVLMLASFLNIFFASPLLLQARLYIGLAVMCGFIIWDTAVIIENRRRGETDYIWHAFLLLTDFVNVFKHLVIFALQKEERNRKRNK